MATTKIWVVRDDISRVLGYAANPEKTVFESLKQVLSYASNEEKTIHPVDENERALLVTGVNCSADTAVQEMEAVQKRWGKTTGIVAYHAYQSFKTGEVTPEQAHEIGVQLAHRMWGSEVQVFVATHLNTGTYHNHFVINAVGMWDGKKLRCNKGTYFKFRKLSDDLCREHRLTVIKSPTGHTPRNLYFAEKRGEPTKYGLMRQALEEALEISTDTTVLKKILYRKGYVLDMDPYHRYATIRRRSEKKNTRTFRLGEKYETENLLRILRENEYYHARECYQRQREFFHPEQLAKPFQPRQYRLKGSFPKRRVTGLRALYLYYCYRLGPLSNGKPKRQPLSPELREAWRRIDRITAQVTLIGREKLNTAEDVRAFISKAEADMETVSYARDKVRNKLRNCHDEDKISEYKAQRDRYTAALSQMRKDVKIAKAILDDVPKIKANLRTEKELLMEHRGQKQRQKNRRKEYER